LRLAPQKHWSAAVSALPVPMCRWRSVRGQAGLGKPIEEERADAPLRRTRGREMTESGVAMKRVLGPVLAWLTLAACGGPADSPRATATRADPSSSVVAADCGTFNLGQGDRLPESAARCLVEAAQAGHPARLRTTRPSVEGDPIAVTYTAGADGRVEVITDSRQDRFGAQVITRAICTGPIAAPELTFALCSEPTPS
jgi:hypothetical protein